MPLEAGPPSLQSPQRWAHPCCGAPNLREERDGKSQAPVWAGTQHCPPWSSLSFPSPQSGPLGWFGRTGEREEVETRPPLQLPDRGAGLQPMDRWTDGPQGTGRNTVRAQDTPTTHRSTPHTRGHDTLKPSRTLQGPLGYKSPSVSATSRL